MYVFPPFFSGKASAKSGNFMSGLDLSLPGANDPFAEAELGDNVLTKGLVHIRLQQRNGRKSLTTIQG